MQDLCENDYLPFSRFFIFNFNRHFLPFRRANLTISALLQRIRGEIPQLHPLRLTSTATSARE